MRGRVAKALLIAAMLTLLAAAAGTVAAGARSTKSTVKVGIVYSRTGLLAVYGAEYYEGLQLGMKYLTHGTNTVNGHKIQFTYTDDAGDPAKAVSAAKDLIGQGYKILAGSTSSGVGIQVAPIAQQNNVLFIAGPSASDALTGINRNTFRSGRQTYQDVLAANSFLGRTTGKKIVAFVQDSAFGNGNAAAVSAVLGGKGHSVSTIAVPLTAQDFTPFAQRVVNAKPDLVFVAWAGSSSLAMWRALEQQGVFQQARVVTGLAERATWSTFGTVGTRISFLSHYVYNGPSRKDKINNWLVQQMKKRGQLPDLFTPDGFVAAQMIVHAVQKADGDDVGKMISALEGWRFTGPKGPEYIRPQDHALLQPMFQVKLKQVGNRWVPVVLKRISPGNVVPPVRPFR